MGKDNKNVGELISTALISFMATNADDLVVLMNFFTESTISNSSMKARYVFIGQYIGFIILIGFSLIGYGLSYAIPVEMLGFLGFFPIILGIKSIVELGIELYKNSSIKMDEIIATDNISTIELEAIRYRNDLNGEILTEIAKVEEQSDSIIISSSSSPPKCKDKILQLFTHCLNIQTLKVISITLANSGDNVSIYAALFAQAANWQIGVYIIIYLIMVFIWLIISYLFINFRPILNIAQKYARYLVPIVFLGIGIYIIVTSECFPWLIRAIKTKNFKNG